VQTITISNRSVSSITVHTLENKLEDSLSFTTIALCPNEEKAVYDLFGATNTQGQRTTFLTVPYCRTLGTGSYSKREELLWLVLVHNLNPIFYDRGSLLF
jgi:hypothetical protein